MNGTTRKDVKKKKKKLRGGGRGDDIIRKTIMLDKSI